MAYTLQPLKDMYV